MGKLAFGRAEKGGACPLSLGLYLKNCQEELLRHLFTSLAVRLSLKHICSEFGENRCKDQCKRSWMTDKVCCKI